MQKNQYQYLPVHWMDGMKMNKNHFIAQNNAYTAQIAQSVGAYINDINYGLLPKMDVHGIGIHGVKIAVSTDNQQQVQVRLQNCLAVTRGGFIVQVDEKSPLAGDYLSAAISDLNVNFRELKGKNCDYLIVLTINPYERIAYGQADPAELPPRLPFTLPSYSLGLVSANDLVSHSLGDFQIPIGKLKVLEQKVLLDEDYIPPCSALGSHPDLLELHADVEQFFGKMELHAVHIIQKVLQKKQQNEMALIVQKICENMAHFTASHLGNFKLVYRHQPPVYLLNTVAAFARLLKNTLDFYTGSGKEELINYCIEWCDINQGELEASITSLANHPYDHMNINASIEKVAVFIRRMDNLFSSLAKLEYIGKRKDTGIFVKEQVIQKESSLFVKEPVTPEPEVQPKKRRSFLVD
jgi:hypothetical protein